MTAVDIMKAYVLSHSRLISIWEKPAVLPRVHLFLGLRASSSMHRIFTFSFSIRHYICTHTPYTPRSHRCHTSNKMPHNTIHYIREKEKNPAQGIAMHKKKKTNNSEATLNTSQVRITKRSNASHMREYKMLSIECDLVCVFFVMFLVCENDTPHVYIHLYVLFATFLDSSKRTQRFTIKMIKPNLQPTIFCCSLLSVLCAFLIYRSHMHICKMSCENGIILSSFWTVSICFFLFLFWSSSNQ